MKQVSVIIVTYNSEKDIYDCIDSIKQYSDIPLDNIELIIVDNGSNGADEMFANLKRQWGEDIKTIKNTHNGGYGQGNNVGIRISSAPVILIMNPDVRLASPFFKTPLSAFAEDTALIMYGLKQMRTETIESKSSFCCTYMMNGYMRTLLEGLTNRFEWYHPKIQYFSGSCFFVRKEMFESVGLFDETIFMYGEEDDIHYRLMKRFGTHFVYDKNIRYIHLTLERKPDADYEMKLVKVAIAQNEKKGYPRRKTIRNCYQRYKMLYWRETIGTYFGGGKERLQMLDDLLVRIKELSANED